LTLFLEGEGMRRKANQKIQTQALELLRDPKFLFRVNLKLGEMGVIGETKNRMTLFLAALTRDLEKSVSVLVKGPTSSGKNNAVRRIVALVPPECVITRVSLTKKALAYGPESLSGKVFYIYEHRGGRDAEYMTRELQSEGSLEHEHTVVSGSDRTTKVAKKVGDPVFLSTTTEEQVFADDETRYLSLRADESEELTRAVVQAKFRQAVLKNGQPTLEIWHEALRILADDPPEFRYPKWFEFLGEQIPAKQTRARRDSDRFLSLLKAVGRCRSFSDGRHEEKGGVEIDLADYAVAYEILNEAFSFTYGGAHPQALKVAEIVRELFDEHKKPVTTTEVAKHLGWDKALAYKWTDIAVESRLIARELGTHEKNLKRLTPVVAGETRFLPDPTRVLREGQDVAKFVRFVDPLTGETKTLRRRPDDDDDT
jgi:hypothetical protein